MSMKNLDDDDVMFCTSEYNFQKTGEADGKEIFRVCSHLIECVRKDFEKLVSQKDGLISHGLCEAHFIQEKNHIRS